MDNMEIKNKNNEEEIDLLEIFGIILHRWFVIAIAAVLAAALAFSYFYFVATPLYTSTARIMVINRQSSDALTSTDLSSSTTLSSDYVEIVTSRSVLEQVIADLNLEYSVEQLGGMVTAEVITNTRMIAISVENQDPILAKRITDAISAVSSTRICEIMDVENMVSVVDDASVPVNPSSPQTVRNTLIAALLGIVVSVAIIVIRALKDDRIKTDEDVERYLGVSVLGSIPVFETEGGSTGKKSRFSRNRKAEA